MKKFILAVLIAFTIHIVGRYALFIFMYVNQDTQENQIRADIENVDMEEVPKEPMDEGDELIEKNTFINFRDKIYVTNNSIFFKEILWEGDDEKIYLERYHLKRKTTDTKNLGYWPNTFEMLTENLACYIKNEKLYCAPFIQSEQGDYINWEEERKIAESKEWDFDVYAWKNYIYFFSDNIYRYNYKTDKTIKIAKGEDYEFMEFMRSYDDNTLMLDEKAYFTADDIYGGECIHRLDLKTGKIEESNINIEGNIYYEILAAKDNDMLYSLDMTKGKIRCYNFKKKTSKKTTIGKDIRSFLEKKGMLEKEEKVSTGHFYSYKNRIYIQVFITSKEKVKAESGEKKGEMVSMEKSRQLLFSCSWDDFSDFRLEKKFSKWWDATVSYRQVCIAPEEENESSTYYIDDGIELWTSFEDEIIIKQADLWNEEKPNYATHYTLFYYNLQTGEIDRLPLESFWYKVMKNEY